MIGLIKYFLFFLIYPIKKESQIMTPVFSGVIPVISGVIPLTPVAETIFILKIWQLYFCML
jgi:hypothetical protein